MNCDNCKINNASIKYNQTINGKIKECNLCSICAKNLEIDSLVSNTFKDFLSMIYNISTYEEKENNIYTCEVCGNTLNEFKNSGKLGCVNCYKTFEGSIDYIIENIQYDNKHIGKSPKKAKDNIRLEEEIKVLKEKLKIIVEEEDYEEAIKIRDRIKELEKKGS